VGIPDLWLSGWVKGRHRKPFVIWGPKGTKRMMSHLEKAYEFDIHMRRDVDEKFPSDGIRVIVHEIEEGIVFEELGIKITAFEVDHRPIKPAFGYRIDYGNRSVVLSGDTRYSENLIKFSSGVDLLVHEVAAAPEFLLQSSDIVRTVVAHHTTPAEAGRVFTMVQPKLAVYTHLVLIGGLTVKDLIPLTRQTYGGSLIVGEDLMSFFVGDEVIVKRRE
jgi:ribonuclease Z